MREIKFRAWGGKKFIYPELWDNTMPSNWKQHYTLQQFTGLHDRNGKEVFADDILKDSVGHLFRVYACIGGFAIKAEYWRSDLSDLIIGDELILTSLIDAQMQSYISGSVEIIGNRFENPELL